MAASDLLLLTGGTGFVGFATLKYALQKGYHVRAAVRSQAKADAIHKNPVLASFADRLTTVVVPDILASNAYDEAVNGAKYIVHVASPIPQGDAMANAAVEGNTTDFEALLVKPAVQGTLNILKSAKEHSSVKRIVITSSMVTVPSFGVLAGSETTDKVYGPDDRADEISPPYPVEIVAYVQSKIAALNAGDKWAKENKPVFDVITIHPSVVGGRHDNATSVADLLATTNAAFLAVVRGQEAVETSRPRIMAVIDVDDAAKAHIESLREDVKGGQAFLLTNRGGDLAWNDAKAIVDKHFSEAVEDGRLPNNGVSEPKWWITTDVEKTEKTFGKLKSFEETIVGIVEHLELLAKEKK
nr:hypothetical protein B0A51_08183 [Rachicladosporium sp. CCFEE 5018]